MPPSIARPEGKLTFGGLPLEIQQQIVGRMSRKDLFRFQRVSTDCLSLACAETYRKLDLELANSADEENGLTTSHAADTLHTILASEQDYGQHIKSFRLGANDDNTNGPPGPTARSDSILMTRLLWDSRSDACKFLNTTLLLVARKMSKLETFLWDVPVEISGAVYQSLHKIESLRHLRVRLDVSPSPKMIIRYGVPPNHHPPGGNATQSANQFPNYIPYLPPAPGIASVSSSSYPGQAATKLNNVKRKKAGGSGGCNYWTNPRSFSGFKHLSSLSLMSMSNLDCLAEIAECIKASSATLNSLTLTLSTDLARKARKPAPINPDLEDPSDTELEDDELLNDPLLPPTIPLPTATTTSQPSSTNEADIRKERLAQENILATIFDMQSVAMEGKRIEKKLSLWDSAPIEQDSEAISRQLSTLMKSLVDEVASDAGSVSSGATLGRFKAIKDMADLFISEQKLAKKVLKEQPKPSSPSTKKPGIKSKPLNPLASDFQAHGYDNIGDWEPFPSSGPKFSPFNTTAPSSPLAGPPKNYPYPYYTGSNFMPVASKQSSQQISQVKQISNNAQKVAQMKAEQLSYAQTLQQGQSQMYYGDGTLAPPFPSMTSSPNMCNLGSNPLIYDASGDGPYSYSQASDINHLLSNETMYGSASSPTGMPDQILNGLTSVSKKAKTKAKAKPKTPKGKKFVPLKPAAAAESDEEMEFATKISPAAMQPFFAAEPPSQPLEDAMDVDMEHPDEETQELGEDQEILPEAEEINASTPRKRAKIGSNGPNVPVITTYHGPSSSTQAEVAYSGEVMTSEEEMQAYIRATHGLHLESLALEWVPLKPSIVARALDLSILKRITLLEVGPQDAFWTLLTRLQSASPEIAFKSIHTDNVTLPLVKFLGNTEGLEELFMHERGAKQGEEAAATPSVRIRLIRKFALRPHINTLKRLAIHNERNELWDLDTKTSQFLALKGAGLRELAISLNMKTYHLLMRSLAAFRNLYALHIVALRSTDRNMVNQVENINFAVDSLSYCRDMKLKYIGIVNTAMALEVKPEQARHNVIAYMERLKDKKGKSKAPPINPLGSSLGQLEDSESDEVEDAFVEMMASETKLRVPTSFSTLNDVKIFSRQIRLGRL